MAAKKRVLKFRREEDGCELLMSRALYVEEVDEEDDDTVLSSQPPMDGMEYLRRVIKVGKTSTGTFFSSMVLWYRTGQYYHGHIQ